MKFVWPALLGIIRTAYFAYSAWCLLFPLAVAGLVIVLAGNFGVEYSFLHQCAVITVVLLAGLCLYAIVYLYLHRGQGNPNPTQTEPNPWQSGFLSWFGTLKWFNNDGAAPAVKLRWPSGYLVENPRGYRIGGPETRAVLEILQPGDILLRGYEGYLDGEFIRRSSPSVKGAFKPGWFTHVALYVGDLTEADRNGVPPAFAQRQDYFDIGPQRVIHSMSKGVHTEDILTFLRCDYLAVLRLPTQLRSDAAPGDQINSNTQPKNQLSPSDHLCADLLSALQSGKSVERIQVVFAARQAALEKIGESYDFDCSDTTEFTRFSCAELLYYCLRGVLCALPLKPSPHALYPLAPGITWLRMLERNTVTPDDYQELVQRGHLICVWEDTTSKARHTAQPHP